MTLKRLLIIAFAVGVAALAVILVLKLLGVELSPTVAGGFAAGVGGTIGTVAAMMSAKGGSKGVLVGD